MERGLVRCQSEMHSRSPADYTLCPLLLFGERTYRQPLACKRCGPLRTVRVINIALNLKWDNLEDI